MTKAEEKFLKLFAWVDIDYTEKEVDAESESWKNGCISNNIYEILNRMDIGTISMFIYNFNITDKPEIEPDDTIWNESKIISSLRNVFLGLLLSVLFNWRDGFYGLAKILNKGLKELKDNYFSFPKIFSGPEFFSKDELKEIIKKMADKIKFAEIDFDELYQTMIKPYILK